MLYLYVTIAYIAFCFMIFGVVPGKDATIKAVMGSISVLAYKLIDKVSSIAGLNINDMLAYGFQNNRIVTLMIILLSIMWIFLMGLIYLNMSSQKNNHMKYDEKYHLQQAKDFK